LWARNGWSNLAGQSDFHVIAWFINLPQSCDMGDGFTSPLKEGMLRIFTPEKSDCFGWV
jgi:hypothetical protein